MFAVVMFGLNSYSEIEQQAFIIYERWANNIIMSFNLKVKFEEKIKENKI